MLKPLICKQIMQCDVISNSDLKTLVRICDVKLDKHLRLRICNYKIECHINTNMTKLHDSKVFSCKSRYNLKFKITLQILTM